jgi:hypothetical protein
MRFTKTSDLGMRLAIYRLVIPRRRSSAAGTL